MMESGKLRVTVDELLAEGYEMVCKGYVYRYSKKSKEVTEMKCNIYYKHIRVDRETGKFIPGDTVYQIIKEDKENSDRYFIRMGCAAKPYVYSNGVFWAPERCTKTAARLFELRERQYYYNQLHELQEIMTDILHRFGITDIVTVNMDDADRAYVLCNGDFSEDSKINACVEALAHVGMIGMTWTE